MIVVRTGVASGAVGLLSDSPEQPTDAINASVATADSKAGVTLFGDGVTMVDRLFAPIQTASIFRACT